MGLCRADLPYEAKSAVVTISAHLVDLELCSSDEPARLFAGNLEPKSTL